MRGARWRDGHMCDAVRSGAIFPGLEVRQHACAPGRSAVMAWPELQATLGLGVVRSAGGGRKLRTVEEAEGRFQLQVV